MTQASLLHLYVIPSVAGIPLSTSLKSPSLDRSCRKPPRGRGKGRAGNPRLEFGPSAIDMCVSHRTNITTERLSGIMFQSAMTPRNSVLSGTIFTWEAPVTEYMSRLGDFLRKSKRYCTIRSLTVTRYSATVIVDATCD